MEERLRRPSSRDRFKHSSSEDWFKRRQRSTLDGQLGNGPKGHGPSSVQLPSGSNSPQTDAAQKGYTSEHTGKPSTHRPEAVPHDKRTNRRSADTARKGYRANRPSSNSDERSKSAVITSSTFEVKLSDFPELRDVNTSNSKPALSQQPRPWWDVNRSTSLQDSAKSITENKGSKQTLAQHVFSSEKHDNGLAVTPGQYKEKLRTSFAPPAASWANIASQPPKVIEKSPATYDVSSQDETSTPQADQATKKKKRKKKNKSKAESEEQTDNMIQQEPPKFEDEEEFPDLSVAFVNPHKGQRHTPNLTVQVKLTLETMGLSESSTLQPETTTITTKNKATAGKSAAPDSKKVQPQGQKKSKAPVQLDLGNMLEVLEQKQQSQKSKQDLKPVTLSVGGTLPVVHKEPSSQKKHPRQQERIAHNPLDSTSPLVKKGKQREVPKAKKPTPLKRVILKEREERKQTRLMEERDPAHMSSEAGQAEQQSSESLCETTSDQQCDDPASEHSADLGTEETDSPESPVICADKLADENTPSKSFILNSNPNRPKIHSRKFRDYCSQMLSKEIDECVVTLLKELVRFQDRLYQKDPMKARMKRRLVMGLREVLKHLKLRKVKCVIISPNCERVQSKGGLDEALHTIIDTCREQGVPFVFALSRKSLGRCVNKAVPVSLVGIFNYDGAQDHYHKMIELTSEARKAYEVMIADLEVTSEEQQGEENLEKQQNEDPSSEPPATEEPEYIKVWKKMLEKDYNHKFLAFEEQFSSISISTESDTLLDDPEGS